MRISNEDTSKLLSSSNFGLKISNKYTPILTHSLTKDEAVEEVSKDFFLTKRQVIVEGLE